MVVANTLAYYEMATIITLKRITVQKPQLSLKSLRPQLPLTYFMINLKID
jgi:hypothetical protein